ncbi:DUF6318 family protein [Paenarthrobacter sp. FR1]|uniref:DUF6318 family protein n=1 Tax=Paenarthrobacter sp. FR1 TaxID=3439548 RepID=UPI003DA36046
MPRRSFLSASFGRARPAALFLAAAMLLSGCQSGGSPTATSSTTATPAPSASSPVAAATPAASAAYKPADAKGKAQNVPVPVMPELAKENSKAGLEAFIGYYYSVKNHANETGDVSTLSTLNSPECVACSKLLAGTRDSYVGGRWMVGGRINIPVLDLDWQEGAASHSAKLQLVQGAITYYNADATEGRSPSAATNGAFIFVGRYESSWKAVEIAVLR